MLCMMGNPNIEEKIAPSEFLSKQIPIIIIIILITLLKNS